MSDHEQESKDPGKVPTISSLQVDNFFLIERAGKAEAEVTRLRAREAVLVEALERIDSDIKSAADHCDDRAARGLFQFVQGTVREALATLDVPSEKL